METMKLEIPDSDAAIASTLERAKALATGKVKSAFDRPIKVVIEEGFETARFAAQPYYPSAGRPGVPCFEDLAFRIPPALVQDTATLAVAASEQRYRALFGRQGGGLRPRFHRGEEVLGTLKRTLAFYFDDGEDTPEDGQLVILADEHDDLASQANLGAALHDYGRMGQQHAQGLAQIRTFDLALLDEAVALSSDLRGPPPAVDRTELDLRNRLLTLLDANVQRIRGAAAYLWQSDHPDIYHLFTSGYRRNVRLARKRRAATAESPTPELVNP